MFDERKIKSTFILEASWKKLSIYLGIIHGVLVCLRHHYDIIHLVIENFPTYDDIGIIASSIFFVYDSLLLQRSL